MKSSNSKKIQELVQVAGDVLAESAKLERADSEVMASHSVTTKVVFEAKDFSLSAIHENSNFGLRSILNGRLGFVTSNSLTAENRKSFAKEAQLMAQLSPASPHNHIYSAKPNKGHFELWDTELAQSGPKDAVQWASQAVDEALKDKRVSIDRAEVSVTSTHWALVNSAGVELSGAQTACDFSIMGMAKENGQVTSFDYDSGTVWKKSDIDSEIESSMGRFRDSVVNSLNPKKGATYKGPVLFHPYAVLDLLGAVICANSNGQAHAEGLSPWKSKVGELVGSEMLDAFEDPTDRTRVSGWTMFDREGCLTSRHDILHQGQLKFVAQNMFSASRSGSQTTGNAVGGSGSLPKVGFSNFGIQGSQKAIKKSDSALMKELRQGLVLKRFSGNMDPYSGHFSGVAKNSWWIENGQYAHPVSEVMVAGNLFDILKQVLAVGDNVHRLMGSGLAPYVLIDGVSVTSA